MKQYSTPWALIRQMSKTVDFHEVSKIISNISCVTVPGGKTNNVDKIPWFLRSHKVIKSCRKTLKTKKSELGHVAKFEYKEPGYECTFTVTKPDSTALIT